MSRVNNFITFVMTAIQTLNQRVFCQMNKFRLRPKALSGKIRWDYKSLGGAMLRAPSGLIIFFNVNNIYIQFLTFKFLFKTPTFPAIN